LIIFSSRRRQVKFFLEHPIARHEHLPIYKQSYELLNQAVHVTKDFPREFKFTVGQRLRD